MSDSVKNGVVTFLGLTAYFFLMELFGLTEIVELRMFNFIILGLGVFLTIRNNVKKHHVSSYLENLGSGFTTSVVAVGLFAVGSVVFLKFIDPNFLLVLENSGFWGGKLYPIQVGVALFIEGMASGLIMSFVFMQYYKGVLDMPKKRKPAHP